MYKKVARRVHVKIRRTNIFLSYIIKTICIKEVKSNFLIGFKVIRACKKLMKIIIIY